MNRLVDPPRAVPRGLVLKVLAEGGAPSSLFFVGLPEEARADEQGQWRDVPSAVPGTKLALVAAVAVVATAALLRNAFLLYTHFQP